MKLIIGLFIFVTLTNSANAGTNQTVVEKPDLKLDCLVDNICNRLVQMKICAPGLSKNMAIKCPNYCQRCGHGTHVVLQNKRNYSNVYTKIELIRRVNSMDAELQAEVKAVALNYQNEYNDHLLETELIEFEIESIFDFFRFHTDEENANKKRKDIVRTIAFSSLDSQAWKKTYEMLLRFYESYFSRHPLYENLKNAGIHQLNTDKQTWLINVANNELRKSKYKRERTMPWILPEMKPKLSFRAIDLIRAYRNATAKSNQDQIKQLKFIEDSIVKFKNIMEEISLENDLKLDDQLRKVHEYIQNFLANSENGLITVMKHLVNAIKNHYAKLDTKFFGKKSLFNLGLLSSEFIEKAEAYGNYIKSNLDETKKNSMLKLSKKGINMPVYKQHMNLTSVLSAYLPDNSSYSFPKVTSDESNKIYKLIYILIQANEQLSPVCIALQKNYVGYELSCDKLFDVATSSAKWKNSILDKLDKEKLINDEQATKENIKTIVDGATKYFRTIFHAADEIEKKLTTAFPNLKFFVQATRNGKVELHPEIQNPRFLTAQHNGIFLTVFWHSSQEQPIGNIWDKCYEDKLSSAKLWFINRPHCTRIGIVVQKRHSDCDDKTCTIKLGEMIPSCDSRQSVKRIPCFSPPMQKSSLEPLEYMNALTIQNQKLEIRIDTFKPTYIYNKIANKLKEMSLDYCLQAVLAQHYRNNTKESVYYSTTMHGAAFVTNFYFDLDELVMKNFFTKNVDHLIKAADNVREIKKQLKDEKSKKCSKGNIMCEQLYNIREKYADKALENIELVRKEHIQQVWEISYSKKVPEDEIEAKQSFPELKDHKWKISKEDAEKLDKIKADGKNFVSPSDYEYPYTTYTIQFVYYLGIFTKCTTQSTRYVLPRPDFKKSCMRNMNQAVKMERQYVGHMEALFADPPEASVDNPSKSNDKTTVIIAVVVSLVVVMLIIVALAILVTVRKRKAKSRSNINLGRSRNSNVYPKPPKFDRKSTQPHKSPSRGSIQKTGSGSLGKGKVSKSGTKFMQEHKSKGQLILQKSKVGPLHKAKNISKSVLQKNGSVVFANKRVSKASLKSIPSKDVMKKKF